MEPWEVSHPCSNQEPPWELVFPEALCGALRVIKSVLELVLFPSVGPNVHQEIK